MTDKIFENISHILKVIKKLWYLTFVICMHLMSTVFSSTFEINKIFCGNGWNIPVSRVSMYYICRFLTCCHSQGADVNTEKAVQYLETNLFYARRPYSLAITAYALALSNSARVHAVNRRLKLLAKNTFFSTTGIDGSYSIILMCIFS